MKYDPASAAMPTEPWGNSACRGYVMYMMENCGFSPKDTRRAVREPHYVFDLKSLDEA